MAPVTKAESVEGLMSLINNQTMEKSGRFFEYTGVEFHGEICYRFSKETL